jgi:hypothetical protein
VSEKPTIAVADAQSWNEQHMDHVTAGIQVLIPPDSGKREGERPGWTGGRYSFMRRVLATDLGRETYPGRRTRGADAGGDVRPGRAPRHARRALLPRLAHRARRARARRASVLELARDAEPAPPAGPDRKQLLTLLA